MNCFRKRHLFTRNLLHPEHFHQQVIDDLMQTRQSFERVRISALSVVFSDLYGSLAPRK